jgi:hypothetical protein
VSVVNGFTGRVVAAIAVPKDAGSYPWMGGRKTWYPCGAAPDDRTFLLCGADRYYELRLTDDGKPPVITPDGSKVVAAAWTGRYLAELAESSARTGRLTAVLTPPARMPGHGSPCQVLWTDPDGSHLITYCVNSGVVTGTRFTPVHLYVPDTSGISFNELVVW